MIKVKYRVLKIIFLVLIVISFVIATIFLVTGLNMSEEKSGADDPAINIPSINVEELIENIKNKNASLLYESTAIKEFTSLVFSENDRIKSYLIDLNTGEELSFLDVIKEDKLKDFEARELELLNLKYPTFIVEGLTNSSGNKVYYVKDNELTIYYYDYTFAYDYKDIISLNINYNEIHDCLNFTHILDENYTNEDGFNYSKDKKSVAITFDDGPSSKYNKEFLKVLAENKARATFFMVGSMMNSCQKCVLDTYNSGNEIGSHTYNHINIKNSSIELVNSNIKKTTDLFYSITKDHIKYVRPPYGAYNKTNLQNINYALILWNLDTEDWRYKDVDKIVDTVMNNVKDGSIILMHELYETSLEALKIILPKLYAEGYQVVSVGKLAELKGRTIEAHHAYGSFKN